MPYFFPYTPPMPTPLLTLQNLSVTFRSGTRATPAVHNLSLALHPGEIMAMVGESGSGKSVTSLATLGLLPANATITGQALLQGRNGEKSLDLLPASDSQLQRIRGNRVAMIFQEPMTALNPLHSIGRQIAEPLRLHRPAPKPQLLARVHELLDLVGLTKLHDRLSAYPHELSGGERQRVMIAMAMACEPELLIADEPTTAVDVTIQQQILTLLQKLQKQRNLAILFITHDLTIVRRIANTVIILEKGKVVEQGKVANIFTNPQQPYTKQLLASEPSGEAAYLPSKEGEQVLDVQSLQVRYPKSKNLFGQVKTYSNAVDDISLTLLRGQTIGIVGESGSGKTSLALAILRLIKSEGPLVFLGQRIDRLPNAALRPLRQKLQVVFQDPYSSLNPRFTVSQIVGEGLRVHQPALTRAEREAKAAHALQEVGLTAEMLQRFPHEFSGGQRQRIAIARAMVLQPRLVVLDEPTSALDLTVQAQVIELLRNLQAKHGTSFLFISHDLRVIRALSHIVLVMRHGQIVERGRIQTIFDNPQQPYTQQLIAAAYPAA